ncbi:hypothetical protein VTK26DRAFT_3157 [Humicola hyalothermophila]
MGRLPSTVLRRPTFSAAAAAAAAAASSSSTLAATSSTPLSSATTHTLSPIPSLLPSWPCAAQKHRQPQQVRHATFVPRPRRPYQFTQLVQLSDGSTFTMRTTSPQALYKSAKDSRNHMLWQPSEKSLRNVEVDEAGKLAAFRERYGNSWDLGGGAPPSSVASPAAPAAAGGAAEKTGESEKKPGDKKAAAAKEAAPAQQQQKQPAAEEDSYDSLVDLISAYATEDKNIKGGLSAKDQARMDRSGKKK